jgi:hypothetical protein
MENYKEALNKKEFQTKVYSFFKKKHLGKILELKSASLNTHYIKFKPNSSIWSQEFFDHIDVDCVDFEDKTISGFINNSSKLICN